MCSLAVSFTAIINKEQVVGSCRLNSAPILYIYEPRRILHIYIYISIRIYLYIYLYIYMSVSMSRSISISKIIIPVHYPSNNVTGYKYGVFAKFFISDSIMIMQPER